MAKKKLNDRCPLQGECEKTCTFAGHELDCDYYHDFARPGYEIEDQESIRFKREDEAMMAAYEASVVDGDEDDPEDAESPSEAENAAVMPSEVSGEVIFVPSFVKRGKTHLLTLAATTAEIRRAMYEAASSFVYIGYLLWRVQDSCSFMEHGYQNVYEYAEHELGFKKSSTKNFIAINYEFGCKNEYPYGIAHQRTPDLQPEYRDFKYSQLCEMLSMSDTARKKVTPDMTVKQIRELKRGEAEPDLPPNMETIPIALPDDAPDSGQTSGRFQSVTDYYLIVNGRWIDCSQTVALSVVKLAGIKFDPSHQYDITIALHCDS